MSDIQQMQDRRMPLADAETAFFRTPEFSSPERRDLKPSNVLIDREDRVRTGDRVVSGGLTSF